MRLRVFVGHSFHDSDHSVSLSAFRETIVQCCAVVAGEHSIQGRRETALEPYFEGLDFGKPLPAAIRAELRKSDIVVVDISGMTPNIFYELGYAHALGVELVILQRCETTADSLPADIADLLVGSYGSLDQLRDRVLLRLRAVVAGRVIEDRTSTGIPATRCFWFAPDVREIHIVCGPEPERTRFADTTSDDFLFVDNFDDRDTLFEITAFLSRSYPTAKVLRHTSRHVTADVLDANLVLIGGPLTNAVTKDMMAQLKTRLDYVADWTAIDFRTATRVERVASLKASDGILVADAAYFGRFRNPFERTKRIVMCQGCHTFGTLAAAMALADNNVARDNIKQLEAHAARVAHDIDRIECVLETQILRNRRVVPPTIRDALTYVE